MAPGQVHFSEDRFDAEVDLEEAIATGAADLERGVDVVVVLGEEVQSDVVTKISGVEDNAATVDTVSIIPPKSHMVGQVGNVYYRGSILSLVKLTILYEHLFI